MTGSIFFNILPYLNGEKQPDEAPHENLYWKRGNDMAIRHGDWKLMVEYQKENHDTMLFNLSKDLGERRDLITQYPEKAKELQKLFKQWEHSLPEIK